MRENPKARESPELRAPESELRAGLREGSIASFPGWVVEPDQAGESRREVGVSSTNFPQLESHKRAEG